MTGGKDLLVIDRQDLIAKAEGLKKEGYRLAQIGAAALQDFEVSYSFDKDYDLINLKVIVGKEDALLPSMSAVYANAFLYENEIHDLFGIRFDNLSVDYGGNFYRTSVKTPFKDGPVKDKGEKN